ncbi:uncharacterized protein N0V89_012430 [Didymosphaeria variabile]|uniref:NADAR domain-containing protein n=1 Tax=Didymosphaeria variabile TaxID=1932322 RepID=A0A9W9C5E9_9PLEO|nr:uncharacterized protein N0V89_012430 [Didymosphaeria variabile]KAJ4344686.1 hypothetical protein N0V89_012430 [Didymosphaeria variabile]
MSSKRKSKNSGEKKQKTPNAAPISAPRPSAENGKTSRRVERHVHKSNLKLNKQATTPVEGDDPEHDVPVYFYGASNANGFLSQMYPVRFDHAGLKFNSAEQYFQYAKAALFEDEKMMEAIINEKEPKKQKSLGKKVKPFDKDLWQTESFHVVTSATWLKFTKSEAAKELKPQLLATGKRLLAEASPRDKIWGIGLNVEQAKSRKPSDWTGRNLLGQALMFVRDRVVADLDEQNVTREQGEESKTTGKTKLPAGHEPLQEDSTSDVDADGSTDEEYSTGLHLEPQQTPPTNDRTMKPKAVVPEKRVMSDDTPQSNGSSKRAKLGHEHTAPLPTITTDFDYTSMSDTKLLLRLRALGIDKSVRRDTNIERLIEYHVEDFLKRSLSYDEWPVHFLEWETKRRSLDLWEGMSEERMIENLRKDDVNMLSLGIEVPIL